MRTMLYALAVAAAVLATPAALAHHDATHGVLPHSVGDSPLDIHAVDISTPHPYALGEVYTWSIEAAGAATIAIHFERYELNGYYASWLGQCYGSEVRIFDGDTMLLLDSFCGWQPEKDFWTEDYATSSIVLQLVTGGWSSAYGFDIFEIATNGARPLLSVPYSATPSVGLAPGGNAQPDPFAPGATTAYFGYNAYASWGAYGVQSGGSLQHGTFWQCHLVCDEIEGDAVNADADASAGSEYVVVTVQVIAEKDDAAPGGYKVRNPVVECERTGEAC